MDQYLHNTRFRNQFRRDITSLHELIFVEGWCPQQATPALLAATAQVFVPVGPSTITDTFKLPVQLDRQLNTLVRAMLAHDPQYSAHLLWHFEEWVKKISFCESFDPTRHLSFVDTPWVPRHASFKTRTATALPLANPLLGKQTSNGDQPDPSVTLKDRISILLTFTDTKGWSPPHAASLFLRTTASHLHLAWPQTKRRSKRAPPSCDTVIPWLLNRHPHLIGAWLAQLAVTLAWLHLTESMRSS